MHHLRGLQVPTLLVACAAALLCPSEGRSATPAPHSTVVLPRRDAARNEIDKQRRQLAEHRKTWPRFLTDGRRGPRLEARGLLTARTARERRAKSRLGVDARGGGPRNRIAAIDTVDALLVRVGFQTNRAPNLTSMDASGDFRLSADSTVTIDPPPHDANYFDAQLLALRAYYDIVSHGTLLVRGQVFPPQGEPSIKLSDAADYGPGMGGNWTIELLEKYFRDAVGLADSTTSMAGLPLSNFDSIVLVHPGSDLQNDINRDSPNDLPTFFVTLADSIPVQGGQHEIRNGLVLPETLTQDGLVGGILGGLCHEFGHQLGLPDWYDTYFGLPVVGEWDLMDSGNAAFFAFQVAGSEEVQVAYGLLPTGLSAMSRYLLGFEEPVVLRAPEDLATLSPSLSTRPESGPRSARLDVSADEYFLVENRRDLLYIEDDSPCPYLNRDAATGVILWTSRAADTTPPRERTNSGEYDFFIASPSAPEDQLGSCGDVGFGLLVWHVDERILAEGYPFNEVNIDERQRSLRLLEASGDYEIGDWRLPTYGFLGDGWNDPFREGYKTQLDDVTRPDNRTNDWAHSGWEIQDVRFAPPESHTLSVRVVDGVAGWPRLLRAATDSLPPLVPGGAVYATLGGASPALVVADSAGVWAHGVAGARRIYSGPFQPASLAFHPQFVGTDSVGTLAGLDSSRVWLWDARLSGDSLQVRPGFPVTLPGGAGTRLVLCADAEAPGVLAETAGDAWVRVDPQGLVSTTFDVDPGREADPVFGPALANGAGVALVGTRHVVFAPIAPGGQVFSVAHGLDAPDTLLLTAGGKLDPVSSHAQAVVLRRDGALRVVDPVRGLLGGFQDLPRDEWNGLALGDMNGDGELDIVAASATRLAVETSRGAMLLNTPLRLMDVFALQNPVRITAGPLVADVAGDSLPELLVGTDLGLVYAIDAAGKMVPGYPRKLLPDFFPSTLLVADVDAAGGDFEVLGVSSVAAGAVSPPGGSMRPGWVAAGGDAARTRFGVAGAPLQNVARLSAGERTVLAYPNPARAGRVQVRVNAQTSGPFALAIYNLEGQKVFERSGTLQPGVQEIPWDCNGMASGVYLCRFVSAAAGLATPHIEPITLLR